MTHAEQLQALRNLWLQGYATAWGISLEETADHPEAMATAETAAAVAMRKMRGRIGVGDGDGEA